MGNDLYYHIDMHKYIKLKDGGKKENFINPSMCKPDQPEAICLTLWQFTVLYNTIRVFIKW